MKKYTATGIGFFVLFAAQNPAFALFKCVDPSGKSSFQDQPCSQSDKESPLVLKTYPTEPKKEVEKLDGLIAKITLERADILQIGPKPSSTFVYFTLRPRWVNNNASKVKIDYFVRFFDAAGVELYVDSRFKELLPSSSSTVPQVLATFEGKRSDNFSYKDVRKVSITYRVSDEKAERKFEDVKVVKDQ